MDAPWWAYLLGIAVDVLGIVLMARGRLLPGGLLSGAATTVFAVHAAGAVPVFVSRSLDLLERHAATMSVEEIDRELTFVVRQSGGAPSAVTKMRMDEIRAMAREPVGDAAVDG